MLETFVVPLFHCTAPFVDGANNHFEFSQACFVSLCLTCFDADSYLNSNYNVVFKLSLHHEVYISLLIHSRNWRSKICRFAFDKFLYQIPHYDLWRFHPLLPADNKLTVSI